MPSPLDRLRVASSIWLAKRLRFQNLGPPNSPQEPTCGRRLARRFRGSNSATRCVAQPRAIRPHAAQRKNVGPTALSILCLVRNCVELLPAALLPPARCVYSVGRSSLSAACTCEGAHVSHRTQAVASVRATLPHTSCSGKSHVTLCA